jgi:arylsulfatase A-like enzyme
MRVLLVDIDSLRPDHLGCYGYDRDTSPTIDALAGDGVAFEECFVSDSPCLPSRTALATCRHGLDTGVVTHWGSGQWYEEPGEGHAEHPERPLAFRHLSEAGVHTATVTSFAKRHLAYHFTAGFRESMQPTADTGAEDAADVTAAATDWLARNAAEEDWLLHVNYWDVHHPYDGVAEHVEAVRDSGPTPAWPDQDAIDAQQGMSGTRCADGWRNPSEVDRPVEDGVMEHGDWGMPTAFDDRADAEHLVDGYDGSIRKVDTAVAELLAALERAGVREETAVVVTGDHGDALGEHGIYAEHAFPHPPCQRVPMVVSWPGVTDDAAGTVRQGKIYQFDLLATVCELAGLDVPAGWHADSFADGLRDGPFEGREHLVCGHGIYTFGRALYRDDWAFIRLLHPGVFSMPGHYNDPELPEYGLELLYDRGADPHMTENLVAERPEVAADLRARLDGWVAERVAGDGAAGRDPLARMAVEDGPFLYADPHDLADHYERTGRSDAQRAAVERAPTWTPEDARRDAD